MNRLSSASVVVPVYNSADTLPELTERLRSVLSKCCDHFEIVLVNDGSRDESWSRLTDLAKRHSDVTAINLMRNYGQHNALLCGIRMARHEWIVTIDDDLQNPPEEIPRLIAAAERHDVVYGTPAEPQHSLFRNLTSRLAKLVLRSAMRVENATQATSFRLFRTRLRDAFDGYCNAFVSIDVLLTYGTSAFGAVTVAHAPRKQGASNYTLRKLIVHLLNTLTSYSTLPLQLASLLGFVMTLFGLGILGYVLMRYLVEGSAVAGFPFLAAVIAIFSGAQMFALGIIGEYLARIHGHSMGRAPFAIRDMVPPSAAKVPAP